MPDSARRRRPRAVPSGRTRVEPPVQRDQLASHHRALEYVHDAVLHGWDPLRGAKRIFVVVNPQALDRRGDALARVLADAHLEDPLAPVELGAIAGARST
jgi:hypothetical protein